MKKRSLRVQMLLDIYSGSMSHALSTEKEEIMGLLVGFVDNDDDAKEVVVTVVAAKILQRLDKRKDRVEISALQLYEGMDFVENLKKTIGLEDLKIVGWYHSHPRITVWPSDVDLRTQLNYQNMDKNFVGLIFSLYDTSAETKKSRFDVTGFQTKDGHDGVSRIDIDVNIVYSIESEDDDIDPETLDLTEVVRKVAHDAVGREGSHLFDVLSNEEEVSAREFLDQRKQNLLQQFTNASAFNIATANNCKYVLVPGLEKDFAEFLMLKAAIQEQENEKDDMRKLTG